ncbi:MAG: hypothetical protein IKL85_04785 [Lentisphaeria bacterium]|nr:hypothetical protein [Lentisphaeria bacterium]
MNNLFLYLAKKHDESTDSSSDYLDCLDLPQEKEETRKDGFTRKIWRTILVLEHLILPPFFLYAVIQPYIYLHDNIIFWFYDFSPEIAKLFQYDFTGTRFFKNISLINLFIIFPIDVYLFLSMSFGKLKRPQRNKRDYRLTCVGMILSLLLTCWSILNGIRGVSRGFDKRFEMRLQLNELANLYGSVISCFPAFDDAPSTHDYVPQPMPQLIGKDYKSCVPEDRLPDLLSMQELWPRYTIHYENICSSDFNLPLLVENESVSGHYFSKTHQFYRYGVAVNGRLILYQYDPEKHTYSENGMIVDSVRAASDGWLYWDHAFYGAFFQDKNSVTP